MHALLADHARRYPQWELQDLYKLLHQGAMGAEHAVSNEAGVRDWLVRELAELGTGPEEPLLDPLSPDGRLVRVHLRPFAQLALPAELLLQAFLRTAREVAPAPEKLAAAAEVAAQLATEGALPFDKQALAHFFAEQQAHGFRAMHHSESFRKHYQPAYRVVAREFIPIPLLKMSHSDVKQ